MNNATNKKEDGGINKKSRKKAAAKLKTMRGEDFNKLSQKQKDDLLIILLQINGLVDEKGIIR